MKKAYWLVILSSALAHTALGEGPASENYLVCVSNERGGTVTILDSRSQENIATIPVGKRPRGIHASPDGKTLFVAVSGTPISGPPALDKNGNPIFKKGGDDDDDGSSDHAADGIAIVDLPARKFVRKLNAGSDPEQFAVSRDGMRLYVANEDVATESFLNISSGQVEAIARVKKEPEGVALSPDGKSVWVTCETGGEVFVLDAASNKTLGQFTVGGRPRSIAFSPDGSRAFIPSESSGQLHIIDTASRHETKTLQLPPGSRPMGNAIAPDGKKLYLSTGRGGTVLVIDTEKEAVSASIKVGARPWGIALSPDASQLYVANGPSNDISVVDLKSEKEIRRIKCGEGPWGVEVVPVKVTVATAQSSR
jgi:YVTN family beta-propeller protein